MKKDILFANGCSFTAGGGLEPWYMTYNNQPLGDMFGTYDVNGDFFQKLQEWEDEVHPDRSDYYDDDLRLSMLWPHKLMNMLGMSEHVNLAMGCGSNQRTIRTTLEWIMAQDRSTLDRSIAVVQLTEPSRYEYYQEDIDYWSLNKIDLVRFIGTDAEIELANRTNELRLSTYTSMEGIFSIVNTCLTLDNIFKNFGIEYYLCTAGNDFDHCTRLAQKELLLWQKDYESHKYSTQSIQKYRSLIDKSCNWINGTYEKSVVCAWDIQTIENDAHYSVQGHTQLASLIHSHIR